jgi:Methyltransferase domain
MPQDLTAYRQSDREQARIQDLFDLLPRRGILALDVGARDGYLSLLLADRFDHVVSLDLEKPRVQHPRVEPVQGDASNLPYADDTFDGVLCAEVLEHIPTDRLERVCSEIARVTAKVVVIGVPFREDRRVARTRCRSCGKHNPSWGHVNSFDEARLRSLFPGLSVAGTSFVGRTRSATNGVSAWLMDRAGNPYGTYEQEEGCVHCGAALIRPTERTLWQKGVTKVAHLINRMQERVTPERANWIHVRFEK